MPSYLRDRLYSLALRLHWGWLHMTLLRTDPSVSARLRGQIQQTYDTLRSMR